MTKLKKKNNNSNITHNLQQIDTSIIYLEESQSPNEIINNFTTKTELPSLESQNRYILEHITKYPELYEEINIILNLTCEYKFQVDISQYEKKAEILICLFKNINTRLQALISENELQILKNNQVERQNKQLIMTYEKIINLLFRLIEKRNIEVNHIRSKEKTANLSQLLKYLPESQKIIEEKTIENSNKDLKTTKKTFYLKSKIIDKKINNNQFILAQKTLKIRGDINNKISKALLVNDLNSTKQSTKIVKKAEPVEAKKAKKTNLKTKKPAKIIKKDEDVDLFLKECTKTNTTAGSKEKKEQIISIKKDIPNYNQINSLITTMTNHIDKNQLQDFVKCAKNLENIDNFSSSYENTKIINYIIKTKSFNLFEITDVIDQVPVLLEILEKEIKDISYLELSEKTLNTLKKNNQIGEQDSKKYIKFKLIMSTYIATKHLIRKKDSSGLDTYFSLLNQNKEFADYYHSVVALILLFLSKNPGYKFEGYSKAFLNNYFNIYPLSSILSCSEKTNYIKIYKNFLENYYEIITLREEALSYIKNNHLEEKILNLLDDENAKSHFSKQFLPNQKQKSYVSKLEERRLTKAENIFINQPN